METRRIAQNLGWFSSLCNYQSKELMHGRNATNPPLKLYLFVSISGLECLRMLEIVYMCVD